MSYTSWSVVFGEQPSATKWNILGANDASFNDGTGIASLSHAVTAVANPYKFRASLGAAANSGNGAFAKVPLDTEQFDTNNNFAGGTYTATAGFYQFNWLVTSAASASTWIASLFKNGSEISRGAEVRTALNPNASGGSDLIQLSSSDTIELHVFGNSAVAIQTGVDRTYLSGHRASRT